MGTGFKRKLRLIVILFLLFTMAIPLLIYLETFQWKACLISLAGCALFCVLAFLLHKLDDCYITGVAVDLSRLVDTLLELEEREIFAGNEDTVVSKLQDKVIKLMRMLKNKNKLAEKEHENIKELVSDISHQLKTPISNLKMYSRFLEDKTLTEEKRREYVKILCMSVERLNFLSENMIQMSRLESGMIQLDMRKQSLNETVMISVKNIYSKAKERQIEIEYKEDTRAVICHDRNWTAEAVFNLLDNAVKYADRGNKVILSVRRLGMFVEVAVEDENGAIPEDERSKVFKRFYRGRGSREKEGIGIGLYLSREIAIKQGGYMNLKVTDKGNVFSVLMYMG